MNGTKASNALHLSLLTLVACLILAGTATAGVRSPFPGKLCGSVSGAQWRF